MISPELPVRAALPAIRRIDQAPEHVLYMARAGLGALPSGAGIVLVVMAPQLGSLGFLLWAIWWPYPTTPEGYDRAIAFTAVLSAVLLVVGWLVARRHRGFVLAALRAPFIRITVTDRRLLWTVPWSAAPLIEIGRGRVLGGIVGTVDRRGRGNAAIELVPGDPAADIDGHVHFDRMPRVAEFVKALGGR